LLIPTSEQKTSICLLTHCQYVNQRYPLTEYISGHFMSVLDTEAWRLTCVPYWTEVGILTAMNA